MPESELLILTKSMYRDLKNLAEDEGIPLSFVRQEAEFRFERIAELARASNNVVDIHFAQGLLEQVHLKYGTKEFKLNPYRNVMVH